MMSYDRKLLTEAREPELRIHSPAIGDDHRISEVYSHMLGTENIPIEIVELPRGTQTLVVTMIDEDTPGEF